MVSLTSTKSLKFYISSTLFHLSPFTRMGKKEKQVLCFYWRLLSISFSRQIVTPVSGRERGSFSELNWKSSSHNWTLTYRFHLRRIKLFIFIKLLCSRLTISFIKPSHCSVQVNRINCGSRRGWSTGLRLNVF